jgi:PAS domain S-box-containing protein
VNDLYCEIMGRPREELLSLSLLDLNYPDYHEKEVRLLADLAAGKIPKFVTEKRYRGKDGKEIWARLTGKAVRDPEGKLLYFLGTIQDISAEKQSRTELKAAAKQQKALEAESREVNLRFQQILDAIPDMVLVKGPESRIHWANKAFRGYYGMTNEELHGLVDASFSLPGHTEKYIEDDRHVFETGQVREIAQELVRGRSGEVKIFHTVKSPILDERGNISMTVGVSRDITEKLATEKAVEEQNMLLASSAKMSALGVMAGGIAHEINNPLGIIQGITANLLDEHPQLPLPVREGLKKIHGTSVRIAKVIRGLRLFSRNADLDPMVSADPNQILRDTLELCAEKFRADGVELRLKGACRKPVQCRPTEIAQVLLNLLQNAYDAVAGSDQPWVQVEMQQHAERVVFKISDSGSGIDPAVATRMMDPFFTTKEVGKGTGLGLSLSKKIMESHGGRLEYLPGDRNTVFVMSLPL